MDACLWANKLNFTGRLIYFDYQQRNCTIDSQQSSNTSNDSSLSADLKRYISYYRSTLSFRSDPDSTKSLNSSKLSTKNVSSSNRTNTSVNSCPNKIRANDEYISYSFLNSHLSKSSQLSSRSLFDTLNFVIRLLTSNTIDCKTYRLKQSKKKTKTPCHFAAVNVYSTRKSSSNPVKKQIELIGHYSTINNTYQSCYLDKHKDLSAERKALSSRIYYITSLFDEPFLMLRKGTTFHANYTQLQMNLKTLRGRIFDFHEIEGFCVDLAKEVCSILNITCRFRIVRDGNFGSKNASTGIWDGKKFAKTYNGYRGKSMTFFTLHLGISSS